jgi:hypothetical protein
VNTLNFNKGIVFTNVKSQALLIRGNATTGTWTCTQNINCSWVNCLDIGGRSLHVGDQSPVYTNYKYVDNFSGTTTATNPHYSLEFATGCANPLINGVTFAGLANQHPYNGIASFSACYNIKVRNIGTALAPLSLGSANQTGVIVNFGGNNDVASIQRCYTSATRTGTHAAVNTDNNIVFESVAGDYADTSVITSLNTVMKGCKLTGATTGQISVYGSHWKDSFTSATVGKIEIFCNEPTSSSAAQCSIVTGTPKFNSVGQIAMTVLGQQIQWEMPYFAKGHTALANLAITLTGTNTANMSYEFQCDKGAGYNGTWLVLNAANLTGAGAITPATGVRLKVRATCTIANAGNLLTNIAIPTVTTATDQNQTYPLDTYTLTLSGLTAGSDIVILQAGTEIVRTQVDSYATSSYAYVYETPEAIDICLYKAGQIPSFIRNFTLPSFSSVLPVTQVIDPSYLE